MWSPPFRQNVTQHPATHYGCGPLAAEAAAFVAELRSLDLQKPPGLAETIDWAQALTALGTQELDVENVQATLGSVLKYHEDLLSVRDETLAGLVASARAR